MAHYEQYPSPVGDIYLVFTDSVLTAITFEKPPIKPGRAPASFKQELAEYFDGTLREFTQEFDFKTGTEFERQVWGALMDVPYGETRTYKWLAEKVQRPRAQRAVGQALSKNPIPIVVPCHRIIESDGGLGGYSSGVEIKNRLLKMEYYHSIGINDGP